MRHRELQIATKLFFGLIKNTKILFYEATASSIKKSCVCTKVIAKQSIKTSFSRWSATEDETLFSVTIVRGLVEKYQRHEAGHVNIENYQRGMIS